MRKILILVWAAILPAIFVGCSKDDANYPLLNTTWKWESKVRVGEFTLSFGKTDCTITIKAVDTDGEFKSSTMSSPYTYNSPIVTFSNPDFGVADGSGNLLYQYRGYVEGNKMKLIGEDGKVELTDDDEEWIFIKQ
jgi:hypothetical protein